MYYTASVMAYDFMDSIQWTANVRQWDYRDDRAIPTTVVSLSGLIPGEGRDNPTLWLRQLLEAVREAM